MQKAVIICPDMTIRDALMILTGITDQEKRKEVP